MTILMRWLWPLAACCASAPGVVVADDGLEEILVTASLRTTRASELAQSVSVLDGRELRQLGVQHFEDILGAIPNLNWAAGTSRPRFFQLRGIGEVEQYQGAPNPSVGFLIDDIDFSGVGMPATLFDVRQVEVLRGPQGTAYGANALAGLISVRSNDPGTGFELNSELTGATYDTRSVGLVVGDGVPSGAAGWRVVAQRYLSDGFRQNTYLNRNATNGYDETTLRAKLHGQLDSGLRVDLTLMHADLNNGYDAWSIYNTYTTYTNQPGRDSQRSNGAALRLSAAVAGVGELVSVSSVADSAIVYSFDGDWGNDLLWGAYAPYDYFQSDRRNRRTIAEDLRLISDAPLWGRARWLAGAYALRLAESDTLVYTYQDSYNGSGSSGIDSRYSATNVAGYGSLDVQLDSRTRLSGGLRAEVREARYSDSSDIQTPFPAQTNHMVGGNLALAHESPAGYHEYLTLSRGYKGGGFNIGSQILSEQRAFGPETLWSLEAGVKRAAKGGALEFSTDLFYMRRQHMQVYLSEQLQQNNPLAYVFYTQNASDGENYGGEAEARYHVGASWLVSAGASLLRTRYLNVGGAFAGLGLDGRAQPFAPGYKLSAAVQYDHPAGAYARLDTTAVDNFYYYTSDAQTSTAHHLENVRLGYRRGALDVSFWVRNLLDARYAQQGFYFGLIPPSFPNQAFVQLGDPRQVGVTLRYELGQHRG